MPIIYYLIEPEPGPYSVLNKHRPLHLDAVSANWSGYWLEHFGYFLCQVNTILPKHAVLSGLPGAFDFPDYTLDTVLDDMFPADKNRLQNAIESIGMIYYPLETVEELIHRYICYSEWEMTGDDRDDLLGDASVNSNGRAHAYGSKWNIPTSDSETILDTMKNHGPIYWNPRKTMVGEF
jgi:hypothetical protein